MNYLFNDETSAQQLRSVNNGVINNKVLWGSNQEVVLA